jgi:hypothetical protein
MTICMDIHSSLMAGKFLISRCSGPFVLSFGLVLKPCQMHWRDTWSLLFKTLSLFIILCRDTVFTVSYSQSPGFEYRLQSRPLEFSVCDLTISHSRFLLIVTRHFLVSIHLMLYNQYGWTSVVEEINKNSFFSFTTLRWTAFLVSVLKLIKLLDLVLYFV